VQNALARAQITFVPLTAEQLSNVRVTRTQAQHTATRDRSPGWGTIWKTFGCIYLGMFQEHHPGDNNPRSYAAYVVQLMGTPVPDHPIINIGVVVVDAQTGELGPTLGGGDAPNGMMGTTCGRTVPN
jgi:hypothetical protein